MEPAAWPCRSPSGGARRRNMDQYAIAPEAVARAVAFAIEQPRDVEIGEIVIRPATQN
ncbi:hypothetical protein GCM10018952_33050 [Streptosporangium vulgare]